MVTGPWLCLLPMSTNLWRNIIAWCTHYQPAMAYVFDSKARLPNEIHTDQDVVVVRLGALWLHGPKHVP